MEMFKKFVISPNHMAPQLDRKPNVVEIGPLTLVSSEASMDELVKLADKLLSRHGEKYQKEAPPMPRNMY